MIQIRRATTDDAKVVGNLVDDLFVELGEGKVSSSDRALLAGSVLSITDSVFCFLACLQEDVVGVILVNEGIAMFAGGAFGQITELYVTPVHRSAGVAAELLREVTGLGRARGWCRIDVGAPHQPNWYRTVAFYKLNGFVEVGPRLKLVL
ncbi:GNAT family N-acetyltransferase [Burkholderia sp. Bp9090]|uniref:GNAT family N-acetyltransferase n=1 Tax=Burkholderia sp. Bp9090 TaxID=2184567 RepID=UPI001639EA30|nr:GNAT family N-acetyltransferase [Burkholderia sp. Bp9090]